MFIDLTCIENVHASSAFTTVILSPRKINIARRATNLFQLGSIGINHKHHEKKNFNLMFRCLPKRSRYGAG